MSFIKIKANNIEIDFVKESLTIKQENNSFSTDFKINHSTFPFLVIENEKAELALGNKDITSINKTKIIDVEVEQLGVKYKGELQVLSCSKDFRKCNLKFTSDIFPVLNKKLSELMPVVSVIPGETSPVPYTEESNTLIAGESHWVNYPNQFINDNYPDALWQFPSLYYKDKFGVNLTDGDEWFYYLDYINKYNGTDLMLNTYTTESAFLNPVTAVNKNIVSPQLYVLTVLKYIFDSISFKTTGDFFNDFTSKLLLLSTNTNTYKFYPKGNYYNVPFNDASWIYDNNLNVWAKFINYTNFVAGDYFVNYNFNLSGSDSFSFGYWIGDQKTFIFEGQNTPMSGTHSFVKTNQSDEIIFFIYNTSQSIPSGFIAQFRKELNVPVHLFHPTIDFSRYVPDKTVGAFLNDLKKLFNLRFSVDDFKKEVSINFVENNILQTPLQLLRSFNIPDYEIVANSSFTLKYENDQDVACFITTEDAVLFTNQKPSFNTVIGNGFKYIPHNGTTSQLTEDVEQKSGIGLMIYNSANSPFTSNSYESKNLNIFGVGGIYETYWEKTLKIRLTASGVEVSGSFTRTEVEKILKIEDLYFDKQHYKIILVEFSEESQDFLTVKMNLESVNL